MTKVDVGGLTKNTLSNALKEMKRLDEEINNPLKVIGALQISIPEKLLEDHYAESNITAIEKTEVVLSMYLKDD